MRGHSDRCLYPWGEDIENALGHISDTTGAHAHFYALYDAFLKLQQISPAYVQWPKTPVVRQQAWYLLLDALCLLERWYRLIVRDPLLSVSYMTPLSDHHGFLFYFPGLLIRQTIRCLDTFSWELLGSLEAESHEAMCIPPRASCVLPMETTFSLSHSFLAQLKADQQTHFQRIDTAFDHSFYQSCHNPLMQGDHPLYLKFRYACATNAISYVQTVLQTEGLLAVLPSASVTEKREVPVLDVLHPFYAALAFGNIEIALLLLAYRGATVLSEDFLQCCLDHQALSCIMEVLGMQCLDPRHLLKKQVWIMRSSNGIGVRIESTFLMAMWSMIGHDAAFHIQIEVFKPIFLMTLLRLLSQENLGDFATLIEAAYWQETYHSLMPDLLLPFFDELMRECAHAVPELSAPPTLAQWQRLVTRIIPLPWILAQLTDDQWQQLLREAKKRALASTDVTALPIFTAILAQCDDITQWMQTHYRANLQYHEPDGWMRDYMQAKRPDIAVQSVEKVRKKHTVPHEVAGRFRLFLQLPPAPSALLDPIPNTLFSMERVSPASELDLVVLLEDMVVLYQDCQYKTGLFLEGCEALLGIRRCLEVLDRWTDIFKRDVFLSIKPHVRETSLPCELNQADVETYYPLILALQLVDILARLPWESLLVSLRDQHTAPIFSQRFQKQLRKDIRTQFSRVVSHWQSIAQQAIQTQPQNAVSLVRCVRLATLMNLRESLAALCQRNASAPILPVPYEWDTLLFCLRSGSVEMCLYFQRLSQLTADGGVVYDQSTLMYFLIQQRISYPCILYAISAGWLMPETLLIEAPHAFACVFEHFYLPGVKFIRLLAQYLETDPLCRDLYSIHDCICMMLLVCVKPAHVACVPTLFADEVFTAYFCELSSQHLNRLFCATLAQIDNESDCRDFLTFEARKALVLQWCVYLTENQWFNLLKTEQYPACIMQHRASGKRYPNLEQAFVRFSEEQEQEAKQKADALIAECEAEENAKSAKQKQQKKKIEQGKKKCEQYNVERVAEAKQAQAEKVRAEKIQLAQLKQAQKQERAARLAEEQRLHEAAIQAALLRVVTVEAVSVAFKTETKEAEAEVVLQDAVPVAVEPSVSADVSVALPMVSVAPPVAEVLPSMIQHVLEAVPATWPVLIPGHMDRASTEWHLWLLVPPSYAGQLSQLPMALWQWLPVAYRDTYVYAQGQAYPECRLSPYVLSDGTVIVLTMTQLSAHPEVDVAELLHPGLISLTTTRWDLKNKRWFFSTERALSDLAERKLTVLNGDKKVWDYSHETIAFSIKTCAKYCIPQQGFLFTESLRSVLESMLSIVPHAARVIWMLCEKESYFMRRPQAIWCMFWLLQNKTDDTRVIENSLRYLQHMARDIQRTRDTMERLSFWFVAYAILRRATYWDDTAQLVRETVEDAHVLTLLPTPAEKDGLAARMFTSLQHYTVFTRPEWTGTARSIPVGSSAAV